MGADGGEFTNVDLTLRNAFGADFGKISYSRLDGGSNCRIGGVCIFTYTADLGFDGNYALGADAVNDSGASDWKASDTSILITLDKQSSDADPFKDIAGNAAEKDIISVYQYGVTAGSECTAKGKPVKQCTKKGDMVYLPNNPVTREQMATFLYREAGSFPIDSTWPLPFVDVTASNVFKEYIRWLIHTGITAGTDATHYSPKKSVTRGQMVAFLYALAGRPAIADKSVSFVDVKPDNMFFDQIAWASKLGITSGYECTAKGKPVKQCTKKGDTVFQPSKSVTRGQMATFLMRFLDKGEYSGS
jgi:hypothetical protein